MILSTGQKSPVILILFRRIFNLNIGMDATGTTSFVTESNPVPSGGVCVVTPRTGSINTTFEVNCRDWVDSDNKDQPFIYLILAEGNILNRGIQRSMDIKFPVGHKESDWKVSVEVRVEDSLGAFTVGFKGYGFYFIL